MLKVFDFPQCSEEWDNARRGRLNSSEVDKVLSSKTLKIASLTSMPSGADIETMMKRAKKQHEVLLVLTQGDAQTSDLNASGLKGLVDKGFATIREDESGCSILPSSGRKHIDLLIARGHKDENGIHTFALPELGERPPTEAMDRGSELEPLARIEFEDIMGYEVEEVGYCINTEISPMAGCSTDGLLDNRSKVLEIKCPLPQTHLGYLRKNRMPAEYRAQVHMEMAIVGAGMAYFVSYCPKLPTLIVPVMRDGYTEMLTQCLKQFEGMYQEQLLTIQEVARKDLE